MTYYICNFITKMCPVSYL